MATDPKADLHRYLKAARAALLWKLEGLSEYDVRRPLTPTGTNLLGLVKHLAGVEAGYFGDCLGRPFPEKLPFDVDADPNSDMFATAEESREDVLGLFARATAFADTSIEELPLDALRSSAFPGRVLVVASGGLSHWLPSNDPRDPSVVGERRESLIRGRAYAKEFAAAREPRVKAMGGNPDAKVNAVWDGWFLDRLSAGSAGEIASLGHEALEDHAGSGGHEIRCWLIGQVAVGLPLVWTSYEPVPEWITGMGIGTTFPVV